MTKHIARRNFLRGSLAAAATIVAYNPTKRVWATQSSAGTLSIPELDGQLVLSGPLLDDAADDFGHIVSELPLAVLIPGSVEDVQRLVRFARRHDIKVSGMSTVGDSHSMSGQSQAGGGVVIDMAALCDIHDINDGDAWVDAGVKWRDLVELTLPLGKSPPIITDYIELSIGGTISVGGIGVQTHQEGFIVDNVLELEVVTGRGNLVRCSPTRRRGLFNAVRAGVGQFGIIVRARVRLIDVPGMVRIYSAVYPVLGPFMSDQVLLMNEARFEGLQGLAVPDGNGGFVFVLQVSKYFAAGDEPDDNALLAGLSFIPGTLTTQDVSHFDFLNRIAPTVAEQMQNGLWDAPHPWIHMFVPESVAVSAIQDVLDDTTPQDTGGGIALMFPFRRSNVTAGFLPVPDSDVSFLFTILRNAVAPATVADLLAKNRAIYEQLRDLGGKRYSVGNIPFTQQDWKDNLGAAWPFFVLAKLVYDPRNILTPGQQIFSY